MLPLDSLVFVSNCVCQLLFEQGKTVQIAAFLGSMTASRKLKSILIISPATMLQHWLKELSIWAPGIRRILIHQSGEGAYGDKRNISDALLRRTHQWLKKNRSTRLFEAIDEEDYETRDPSSFCGTGYAFLTTYENVRRNSDIWTNHRWSYVVMDEAQKIRNPDAEITLVCKVRSFGMSVCLCIQEVDKSFFSLDSAFEAHIVLP